VRLADGQLRGARIEHDRVAGLRIGHLVRRRNQDVDLTVRAELELVDVGLGLRARPATDLALAERRPERHPEVGTFAPVPRHAVGPGVIEDAEQVVRVGVVDQQLLVLVLQREDLRMQRVRALHDPVQGEPGEPGHPPVALGQVRLAFRDFGRLAHHIESGRLRLDPGVERGIEAVILHGAARYRRWGRVARPGRAR